MEAKMCKQVMQQCSACGHQFALMYWEDGTYTYLDDPCECHAEFIPLGPSISEWIEQLKETHGYNECTTFSYDDLSWSERAIAQIRDEAMEFCKRKNGIVEHVSGITSTDRKNNLYYNDPSCWPKYIVYWTSPEKGEAK